MNPEDIIREAIAFTELYVETAEDGPTSFKYYAFRDFVPKLLAILRDEVY